ncbi:acyl-CoA dehydrogenase family protein [Pseudorhodoferax soli]|uniref:Alkylation response protein AidB-like acyl-CoA dehydrogenase n=1 Tax=Pseudorhodoferax soli TaxID=545864 RepID=A0A368XNP7_9BURK|nr:acyl-CoA dehydrogenase family protein [Pseudorhodoferax soli]RCW68638.1 hypothetical protein DES41_107159 [Pseudorhodoferax soli]
MNIILSPNEEAFAQSIRAVLSTELPERIRSKVSRGATLSKKDMEDWHALLNRHGWLAQHWPREYGGTGWTPAQKTILEQEIARANAPRITPFGVNMLGPVLIKYGTEAQKQHWLPRILNGADWWCQGYSEPDAGSDLAALRTQAVRNRDDTGEYFLVNGQKTWTTYGHYANMIFCLVRTANTGKKQEGISFLLIDMNTPGVEVRPIVMIDEEHEVNEVFFRDVKVPVENLVGEEGRGWDCAKYLLRFERSGIAGIGLTLTALAQLKSVAERRSRHGAPLSEDPVFGAEIAKAEISVLNLVTTNRRAIAAMGSGAATGFESSLLKVRGSEIRQHIWSLIRRAMGAQARTLMPPAEYASQDGPADPGGVAAARYFNARKLAIYGGSNEIQKNIVSKIVFST